MTGSTEATLHFVENQQRAVLTTTEAQRLQEFLRQIDRAADALNRFDDHRSRLIVDHRAELVDIGGLDECDIERLARERIPLLVCTPRNSAGRSRASMEAAFDRNDLRAAGHLECQAHRVFVRSRTRVNEEHGVEAESAKLGEASGRTTTNIQRNGIALET